MEEVQKLKGQRSALKSKVATVSNKIKTAIQRKKSVECIDTLVEELDSIFGQFSEVNDVYCEILESDDTEELASFKTVNSLSLSEYSESVRSCYDQCVETVLNYELSIKTAEAEELKREVSILLEKRSVYLLEQLSNVDGITTGISVIFDEVKHVVFSLRSIAKSLRQLNVGDNGSLYGYIDACVLDLEHKVVQAKTAKRAPQITMSQQASPALSAELNSNARSAIENPTDSFITPSNNSDPVSSESQDVVTHSPVSSSSIPTAPLSESLPVNSNAGNVHVSQSSVEDSSSHSSGTGVSSGEFTLNSSTEVVYTNSQSKSLPSATTSGSFVEPALGSFVEPSLGRSQGRYSDNQRISGSRQDGMPGMTQSQDVNSNASPHSGSMPYQSPYHISELSVTAAYNNKILSTTHTDLEINQSPVNGVNTYSQRGGRFKKPPAPTFDGNRRQWAEFRAIWNVFAIGECSTDEERAWSLKQCLKGKASELVKPILISQQDAYKRMWHRLENHYSNLSISVQSATNDLARLKPVREDDLKSLSNFINSVEMVYSQLGEVRQLESVNMATIDNLTDLLPITIRREWMKRERQLSPEEKIHPFTHFMLFLEDERDLASRLTERDLSKHRSQDKVKETEKSGGDRRTAKTNLSSSNRKSHNQLGETPCLMHSKPGSKHKTSECYGFLKLSVKDKIDLLIKNRACFQCFGLHRRSDCKEKVACAKCGLDNHHLLICKSQKKEEQTSAPTVEQAKTSTADVRSPASTLFAIMQVKVANVSKQATVFYDSGSNTSYITKDAAKRLKAEMIKGCYTLTVQGVGKQECEYTTSKYRLNLLSINGETIPIIAHALEKITGPVSSLNMKIIRDIFPNRLDIDELQRQPGSVDILLGTDYFGYHPKTEIDTAGPHLSIMEGPLGKCLQGSHPALCESTQVITNITKTQDVENFIKCEEMVTQINPKCGSCKCGKCPIPGHTYSFTEQQELQLIKDNLQYDEKQQLWIAGYPWIIDPSQLPDNYHTVLATLNSTEKMLMKRGRQWIDIYEGQITDMVKRGVARKLTEEERKSWTGPTFYISHLAVENPKSTSTPVRIVFNSSQKTDGVSLNDAMAKGPDCYINDLLGILLRWREKQGVMVGDIRKMYNSISTRKIEQHCHRFLWRNMERDRQPDIYVITRVNMGDKPASAISAEAIIGTAKLNEESYPEAAKILQSSIYVDDIVYLTETTDRAKVLAKETEEVLNKGGFKVKAWIFNDSSEELITHVLGVQWNASTDKISFQSPLNFSPKKRGRHVQPNLDKNDIPRSIPVVLTKRLVLEQVMRLYDPLGILSPFIMLGKLHLRETWESGLHWDDPLPAHMRASWVTYFCNMSQIMSLEYDRCLTPDEATGKPSLIIMSDASEKAYGFAAYVRWQLNDGSYWCRLIMAKSRVAPLRRLSMPQLELNGAVTAKRARQMIEKETRFEFGEVFHLIDSETVLHMLNKSSTRFKLYEGVRVGEIQAACSGDMSDWYWIAGKDNNADWVTRGRMPDELGPLSQWYKGPDFMLTPVEHWPIKSQSQLENKAVLPGEKKVAQTNLSKGNVGLLDCTKYSSATKVEWILARAFSIIRGASFKNGATQSVTVDHIKASKAYLIHCAQTTIEEDVQRYKRLNPVKTEEGFWVVGVRLSRQNSLSGLQDKPQKLLPSKHNYTRLLMKRAHEQSGHRGRDGTLARFREEYWTPQGSKLARSVTADCQLCKKRSPRLLGQSMGKLPIERLKPSPPFTYVMIDLFGPILTRGEVQKRTSGKGYGVVFTDLASRAVHIEACFGYDTESFLLALKRFTSLRGWPSTIYSDQGTQLLAGDKQLKAIWDSLNKERIYKSSTDKGLQWKYGPADSPWNQGAVESLIKGAKKCLKICLGEKRLTPTEFSTVCYEIANILNERPLGSMPGEDSDINLLTPNSLLLGRATSTSVIDSHCVVKSEKTRYQLVNTVTQRFWEHWMQYYAPTLVYQSKWQKTSNNLKVGDIVQVCDSNALRSQYYIAEVTQVYPDENGVVRKVSLRYRNFRVRDNTYQYKGSPDVNIIRSVHRLALLVPVEGQ